MNTNSKLSDQVASLIRELLAIFTRHHADIEIEKVDLTSSVTIQLRVNGADHARVVGKAGRHIRAIQAYFAAVGVAHRMPVRIDLLQPVKGDAEARCAFTDNPQWDYRPAQALLVKMMGALGNEAMVTARPGALSVTFICECMGRVPLPAITEHIDLLFQMIGKREGRTLYIDFIPAKPRE